MDVLCKPLLDVILSPAVVPADVLQSESNVSPTPAAPAGTGPPGTPRPGAQSTENRLSNLGLIPPLGDS